MTQAYFSFLCAFSAPCDFCVQFLFFYLTVHGLVAAAKESRMSNLSQEETQALIQEVLEVYPEKAKKDRVKHLTVNDQ